MDLSYEPFEISDLEDRFNTLNDSVLKLYKRKQNTKDYDGDVFQMRKDVNQIRNIVNNLSMNGIDEMTIQRIVNEHVGKFSNTIDLLKNDLGTSERKIQANENDILSIKSSLNTFSDYNTEISQNATDISDLKNDYSNNSKSLISLGEKLESNEKKIATIDESVIGLKSEYDTMKSELTKNSGVNESRFSSLSEGILKINGQITTNTTSIENLKTDISSLTFDSQFNKLENGLKELESKINDVTKSKAESKSFYGMMDVIAKATSADTFVQASKVWLMDKLDKFESVIDYSSNVTIVYNLSLNHESVTITIPVWSTFVKIKIEHNVKDAKISFMRGSEIKKVVNVDIMKDDFNLHSVDLVIQFTRQEMLNTLAKNNNDFKAVTMRVTTTEFVIQNLEEEQKMLDINDLVLFELTNSLQLSQMSLTSLILSESLVYGHLGCNVVSDASPLSTLGAAMVENLEFMRAYTDNLFQKITSDMYDETVGSESSLSSILAQLMLSVERLTVNAVRKVNMVIFTSGQTDTLSVVPNLITQSIPYKYYLQKPKTAASIHDKYPHLREYRLDFKPDKMKQDTHRFLNWNMQDEGSPNAELIPTSVKWTFSYAPIPNNTKALLVPSNGKRWYRNINLNYSRGMQYAPLKGQPDAESEQIVWISFDAENVTNIYLLSETQTDSQSKLTITINPTNALPSVALIDKISSIDIHDGETRWSVPVEWRIFSKASDGIEQLYIVGEVLLSDILQDAKCVYGLTKYKATKSGNMNPGAQIIFSWESEAKGVAAGSFPTDKSVKDVLSGASLSAAVFVEPRPGSDFPEDSRMQKYAEVNTMRYTDFIITDGHYGTADALDRDALPEGWKDAYLLSQNGIMNSKGKLLQISMPKRLVSCTYIRDPIGTGVIHFEDVDKQIMYQSIMNLQSQVVNLSEMVNDHTKRLDMIDRAMKSASSNSGLSVALGSLTTIVTMINPIAGVAMSLLTTAFTTIEMIENGMSAQSAITITADLLQILVAFRQVLNKPPGFVKNTMVTKNTLEGIPHKRGKYDVCAAASEAMKQLKVNRLSKVKYSKLNEDIPINGMLRNYNVEHIYRPMDMFENKTTFFSNLIRKVRDNSATATERAAFNALSKAKVYPAHQLMRLSNFETVDGKVRKNVWIYGLSDGYASTSTAHLLGNNEHQVFKINKMSGNEIGPGVWKMSMEKGNDGTYNFLPYRSSGMTQEQILVAGGYSVKEAKAYLQNHANEPDVINARVEHIYALKSQSLIGEYSMSTVKNYDMMLMDGQLDALTKTIVQAAPTYNYTLIGNNCQNYVSSITKLLRDPTRKPNWMNQKDYYSYVKALDDNYSNFS